MSSAISLAVSPIAANAAKGVQTRPDSSVSGVLTRQRYATPPSRLPIAVVLLIEHAATMRQENPVSKLIKGKNRILICGVGAALIVLFSYGSVTLSLMKFYRGRLSEQMFGWWLTGMIAETFLPALAALVFWRMARRYRHGWILHILFLPALWVIMWASDSIILYAVDEPDMDGPSGWATMPATMVLIIIVVTYAARLIALGVGSGTPRPTDR
jgi:hypothetical protein